ncbi:MAG: SpoIID/LytB domain-containing protein [Clostridia bacterium]|nr:SpoIID/LytB domain-containing protein [Clostridia bacterium]
MSLRMRLCLTGLAILLALSACMKTDVKKEEIRKPEIPEALELNEDGVPVLQVYDIMAEKSEEMDIEKYVEGVLAGEMNNEWPPEALKAQAVLARTFVLKFIDTKSSMYDGADISTDISEAQAYAEGLINENIVSAVQETRGEVVSYDGELIQAWFHAHAGGVTETADVGLEYKENPPYIKSVESPDSTKAPENVKNWTATFTRKEIQEACKELGIDTGEITSVEIGKKGESGRCVNLVINGKTVSAASLRIRLGSEKIKSTLLNDVRIDEEGVVFTGSGYGHGVGMSQWGAYAMAESGKTYDEIIKSYFSDVDIVKVWS